MLPLVALKEVSRGPTKERLQSGCVGHMTEQLTLVASISSLRLSTADSQLFRTNSFRLIQFRKNASVSPLESHTFKTIDLKLFRFIHFKKKGRGWVPLSYIQSQTSKLCSSLTPLTSTLTRIVLLSPLDSALTSKRAAKSFTSNTYEKHTQGEGVLPSLASSASLARVTSHESRVTASR